MFNQSMSSKTKTSHLVSSSCKLSYDKQIIFDNFNGYFNFSDEDKSIDLNNHETIINKMISKINNKYYNLKKKNYQFTLENYLNSRQLQVEFHFYKKLIKDEIELNNWIRKKKNDSSFNIKNLEDRNFNLFFENLENQFSVGETLYLLSFKNPNNEVISFLNDFYENEKIGEILWALGCFKPELNYLSLNDINFYLEFFEDSFSYLSILKKNDDRASRVFFTTIKNLLIEVYYRIDRLHYQDNENITRFHRVEYSSANDLINFNVEIGQFFQKCEIVSFFNCINKNCGHEILQAHGSYKDGVCSNCGKDYEEKTISFTNSKNIFITGGDVTNDKFNELQSSRPHLLLNYPEDESNRIPVFIPFTHYNVCRKIYNDSRDNIQNEKIETLIKINKSILGRDNRIEQEFIFNNNKEIEYNSVVKQMENYSNKKLVNDIGVMLFNNFTKKCHSNKQKYENNSDINGYHLFIETLGGKNLFDLIITHYQNKMKLDAESKKKFTDLPSKGVKELNSPEIFSSDILSDEDDEDYYDFDDILSDEDYEDYKNSDDSNDIDWLINQFEKINLSEDIESDNSVKLKEGYYSIYSYSNFYFYKYIVHKKKIYF